MARSTKIYIVSDAAGPVAAFTVKHELHRWLEQYGHMGQIIRSMPDGPRPGLLYPSYRAAEGEEIHGRPEFAEYQNRSAKEIA